MTKIKSICVFCGAASGNDPAHADTARRLGAMMGERGIRLVFGAGHVGLMGIIADSVLAAGGEAVGVIPNHLMERELGHNGLTELHVVDNMHMRKQKMFDLADAIAVLPGGFGTLDETFEVITWKQLGLHDKPIVLVDSGGYWQPFIDLIARISEAGFAHGDHERLFATAATPEALFALLDTTPEPQIAPDPTRF